MNTLNHPPGKAPAFPNASHRTTSARAASPALPDVRQAITDRIIALLEQGVPAFRQRWTRAASRGLPLNGLTGAPYHGANVLVLWDAAIEHGYAAPVWLTYKQAERLGAQVRRGEHGVLGVHFERRAHPGAGNLPAGDAGPADDCKAGGAKEKKEEQGKESIHAGVLLCRPFRVFNAAQIDGLPAAVLDRCAAPPAAPHGPVEGAMRLLGGCGATIRHGFERAMYLPGPDEIRLPWPRQFTSVENHFATALHELVHWTGHPQRLHRTFGARFGDAAYAFEELVAELGSAFAMGHCGLVEATVEGHAAYLEAWLRVLRRDRTAIFTAARLAGEAFEFIRAREMPVLAALPDVPSVPPVSPLDSPAD